MKKIAYLFHGLLMFALILALALSISAFKAELVQFSEGSSHIPEPTLNLKTLKADSGRKIELLRADRLNCPCETPFHYRGFASVAPSSTSGLSEKVWSLFLPQPAWGSVRPDPMCELLRRCCRELAELMRGG
jgi:hypothetical protein